MNKYKIISVLVFALFGFLALQVPLTHVAGSRATFTLFDAFAPIAGAFLGSIPGLVAVLLMQVSNLIVHYPAQVDIGMYIRLLPMLGAVLYFARPSKWLLLIPLAAIISFNLNPVGRSVWYFSLYWLIPVVAFFWYEKSLFIRSLGATFTAHAVGGGLWIWAFNLPKTVWVGLIPVVAIERLLFAAGMCLSYVVCARLISYLMNKRLMPRQAIAEQAFSLRAR